MTTRLQLIIIILIIISSSRSSRLVVVVVVVHTDREVTANRPDIIIKNKKRENMHTDRCDNTPRKKFCAKGSGKEVEIQEFVYRDAMNVRT